MILTAGEKPVRVPLGPPQIRHAPAVPVCYQSVSQSVSQSVTVLLTCTKYSHPYRLGTEHESPR